MLDATGAPVPGYGAADATLITSDALAPGTRVTWGGKTTLPTGSGALRLRFDLSGGDLYAYSIG